MNGSWNIGTAVTLLAFVCISCAAGMSEQARSQVTYMGTFAQVQQQPERYKGETVMWGGKIVEAQPGNNTSELVVLQLALSGQDRPKDNDQSQGRFLVRSNQFLDPALYPPGTLVTIIGRVQGSEKRLIGKMAYDYPVIDMVEVKKWPVSSDSSPRFHFGIGVGKTF